MSPPGTPPPGGCAKVFSKAVTQISNESNEAFASRICLARRAGGAAENDASGAALPHVLRRRRRLLNAPLGLGPTPGEQRRRAPLLGEAAARVRNDIPRLASR